MAPRVARFALTSVVKHSCGKGVLFARPGKCKRHAGSDETRHGGPGVFLASRRLRCRTFLRPALSESGMERGASRDHLSMLAARGRLLGIGGTKERSTW